MAKRRQPPSYSSRKKKEPILIVCEGKTEKVYLHTLKISLKNELIDIKDSGGGSALKIVQYAQQLEDDQKRASRKDGSFLTEPYKHIWCVFDTEGGDKRPVLLEAIALAKKRKYHYAVSNPCFEIWYLLHFTDNISQATPSLVNKAMEKYISNYKKGQNIFKKLKDHQIKAIERAERFHKPDDEFANPTTTVYALVRFLYNLKT